VPRGVKKINPPLLISKNPGLFSTKSQGASFFLIALFDFSI